MPEPPPAEPRLTRRIVQIAVARSIKSTGLDHVYALCSDGTVWIFGDGDWRQLAEIPQT